MNWGVVERMKIPEFRNNSFEPIWSSTFTFEKDLRRHYIGNNDLLCIYHWGEFYTDISYVDFTFPDVDNTIASAIRNSESSKLCNYDVQFNATFTYRYIYIEQYFVFSTKHSATIQLLREDYSLTHFHRNI